MTTVETLYAGLSEASIADGFLNRFLFITAAPHAGPISPPRLDYEATPPKLLLEALTAARASFPKKLAGKTVVPMEGGEDGDAYRRWGEVFIWQQAAQSDLAGRAAENTIRLAALRAISRAPAAPAVSLEDVEWGVGHRPFLYQTDRRWHPTTHGCQSGRGAAQGSPRGNRRRPRKDADLFKAAGKARRERGKQPGAFRCAYLACSRGTDC